IRPRASNLVEDRYPGVCLVSGATEENIVSAIFGELRIIDMVSRESSCVVGRLICRLSLRDRGRLRGLNRAFLSFLFALRDHCLLSSLPRLLHLGGQCNCNFGARAEAVEFGGQCCGTHQTPRGSGGDLAKLRPRRVSSSCELVAAFPAVPNADAPSLDGSEHASRTLVLSSKASYYLHVLSAGDCSITGAEAPGEPYLLSHQPFAAANIFALFSAAFCTAKCTTAFSSSCVKPDRPPFCMAQMLPFFSIVTVSLAFMTCSSSSTGSTTIVLPTLAKVTATGWLLRGSE